ncbi:hypothetical protein BS78_10G253700 [Paspalum vaginatum]|nr:hypothetical protein BS78_10G253700 [Paspalum vaginatum]
MNAWYGAACKAKLVQYMYGNGPTQMHQTRIFVRLPPPPSLCAPPLPQITMGVLQRIKGFGLDGALRIVVSDARTQQGNNYILHILILSFIAVTCTLF